MKHLSIRVVGRVQGVFFRHSAREKALALGLSGLARNEPDGSVSIEVEGGDAELEEFVAWCRVGSKHSRVEGLESYEEAIKHLSGFEIE